jgi:hypothetical protein
VSIKCKTRKKRRNLDGECSGVFLFYALFFMLTKKSAVTDLPRALWYKKRRVLSVLKFLERGPKSWIFWGFPQKVRKSDFPRKRSQNPKKSSRFVTIKKTFFFGNFFEDLIFGHTFLCPKFKLSEKFRKNGFCCFLFFICFLFNYFLFFGLFNYFLFFYLF